VCGLATAHEGGPAAGTPLNATELAARFGLLRAHGVRKVGVWKAPVPAAFLPFLEAL